MKRTESIGREERFKAVYDDIVKALDIFNRYDVEGDYEYNEVIISSGYVPIMFTSACLRRIDNALKSHPYVWMNFVDGKIVITVGRDIVNDDKEA